MNKINEQVHSSASLNSASDPEPMPLLPSAALAYSPCPGAVATVLDGSMEGPYLVARVELEAGTIWPKEMHPEHEERIVVLTGVARVWSHAWGLSTLTTEREGELPRDTWSVEPGDAHRIEALDGPAVYISIMRRVMP